MDDRHDVRAPEVVLPEPLHGEDAPVREDVRDDQGLAVRGDPAGQPLLELDAAARVRGGELRVGERPRVERPRRLVGHPEPDGRRPHQLGRRARDLAEDLVEVERRRDDARQPGDLLEAGEPPVGGRTLAAQPRDPGGRPLPAHGRVRRLRRPAPCIRSAGTGMRRRPRPLARRPGSSGLGRRPRGSCTPGSRSRPPSPPAPRPCRRGTSAPEERARSGAASGTPSAAGRQGRDTAVSPPVGARRQVAVTPAAEAGSEAGPQPSGNTRLSSRCRLSLRLPPRARESGSKAGMALALLLRPYGFFDPELLGPLELPRLRVGDAPRLHALRGMPRHPRVEPRQPRVLRSPPPHPAARSRHRACRDLRVRRLRPDGLSPALRERWRRRPARAASNASGTDDGDGAEARPGTVGAGRVAERSPSAVSGH